MKTAKQILREHNITLISVEEENNIIEAMEEYAQEVVKNLHKPLVSELLLDFLQWIEDVYWDNKGIEDCVNTYLKQKIN